MGANREIIEHLLKLEGQFEAMAALMPKDRRGIEICLNMCRLYARQLETGDWRVAANWESERVA